MHIINKMYLSGFDFPRTTKKDFSYMLAAVPRSGSTYLAIQLWRTGILGAPMEYLNLKAMAKQMMPRFGISGERAYDLSELEILNYWNKVCSVRTSPNGVFGYKMFFVIFNDILKTYQNIYDLIRPDFVIYLQRKDAILQAISYSRAIRSKAWFANIQNTQEVPYDYKHILGCKAGIKKQYEFWDNVFSQAGIDPICVYYEDMLEDPRAVVDQIISEMGLTRDPAAELDIPVIDKQADEVTYDWKERFERDSQSELEENVSAIEVDGP